MLWLQILQSSQVALSRIGGGKWGLCSGQACIAIDYLLVEKKLAPTLVKNLYFDLLVF